jgi:peroxiredoxin
MDNINFHIILLKSKSMQKILYILMVTSIFYSCNKNIPDHKEFQLKGYISGFNSSNVVLKKLTGGELVTFDSVFISDGKFSFKGSVAMPELCFLIFGDMKNHVKIFIENSNMTFSAQIDSLDDAIITGSKSHNEFKSYEEEVHPFQNKMADLFQQYRSASDQNNIPLMEQIDSLRMALNKEMNAFLRTYIGSHKSSAVAPYILSKISNKLNAKELDSMLLLLDKSLTGSVYTKELNERLQILKKTELGKIAPEFTMGDTTSVDFSLSTLKGRIVLVNFWASWNWPSRKENRNLLKTYQEFHLKGFEIAGISLDKDRNQWIKAIREDNLPWKQVSDLKFMKSELVKLYGVDEIPANILIDKEGIIIGKNLTQEELIGKLRKLIK